MNTFSVIMNKQLVGKANSLKEAWEMAKTIDPKNTYDFEDIQEEYETSKRRFNIQVQQGLKQENDWDFKVWLNDKYKGDRIVEDSQLALQRHADYAMSHPKTVTNDDIEQMLRGDRDTHAKSNEFTDTQQKVKPHFDILWVVIHVILAILTGGVSILTTTLPWVVAKYQTNDNCSGLGIAAFSWLYNIYRLAK